MRAVTSLKNTDGVNSVVSPFSSKASQNLSKDKQTAYIAVTLGISSGDLDEDEANTIIAAADPAVDAGIQVEAGGYLGQEVSKPSTHVSEAIGIGVAIVILTLAFGTAVAMMMPISTAIIGLLLGLSVIGLLGHAIEIPSIAPTLGTMIGLGVGIDYALFLVTRYKTRLADGLETDEAIARSCATSGSAVAFAGGTVVIALCSLAFANIPIVSALGYSAAIVVAIAVAGALTLLPALLGVLGPRIHSLKVPIGGGHRHEDDHPHGWARWAEGVANHPWPALIVSVLLLVVLALPLRDMTLGQEDVGQLPESTTARQAYDLLTDSFGVGTNGPLLIAVSLDPPAKADTKKLDQLKQKQKQQQQQAEDKAQQQASAQVPELTQQLVDEGVPQDEAQEQAEEEANQQAQQQVESEAPSQKKQKKIDQQERFLKSTASDPRLTKLQKQIGKDPGIDSVSFPSVSKSGTGAVMSAIPTSSPVLRQDRGHDPPPSRRRDPGRRDGWRDGRRRRQHGRLRGSGRPDLGASSSWSSAIVVGLELPAPDARLPLDRGSDHRRADEPAFSRRRIWRVGRGLREGVGRVADRPRRDDPDRLVRAASDVRGAVRPLDGLPGVPGLADRRGLDQDRRQPHRGCARACVERAGDHLRRAHHGRRLSSFILNGDPTVKQFGVGLAVAIAVDATIVRCLLVPAAMVILGKSNWWLPGWLDRLIPNIGLESEDALPPIEGPGDSARRCGR